MCVSFKVRRRGSIARLTGLDHSSASVVSVSSLTSASSLTWILPLPLDLGAGLVAELVFAFLGGDSLASSEAVSLVLAGVAARLLEVFGAVVPIVVEASSRRTILPWSSL